MIDRREAAKQFGLVTLASALSGTQSLAREKASESRLPEFPQRPVSGERVTDVIQRLWDHVEDLHAEVERLGGRG